MTGDPVLVVDFQKGFTDPAFKMGRSERIHAARDRTAELLDKARSANIPVASCTVGWQSKKDIQYWKVDALHEEFFIGNEALFDQGPQRRLIEHAASPDLGHDALMPGLTADLRQPGTICGLNLDAGLTRSIRCLRDAGDRIVVGQ